MQTADIAPWYHHSTLYQIYPLSFADANGDGYGDLKGITAHLDYLNDGGAESLGVGALWLSPIYASAFRDWGYDIVDHTAIDPRFGTMEDFDELVRKAHDRGMKLLLDYVANHTSDKHLWFEESRKSRRNPKRNWYIWADPGSDGGPPNNWLSQFGGSAWSMDDTTGQYYLHTFLPEQPDLNWRNVEVQEAMLGVLRFWMDRGVDGFRADAVYGLLKDELLRDDPPNPDYKKGSSDPATRWLRVHSSGQSDLNKVIGSFCEVIAAKPGSFLLTEVYLNIPGMHQLYAACREHPVHAPFNFNLMSLPWGAESFRGFIDDYEASMGPEDWPNYVLGNHDRPRVATRVGAQRARLLAMLQMTLRGLPVIYYGDELGMTNVDLKSGQARDPQGRDGERTPMPWNHKSGAGFTTQKPWLPTGTRAIQTNVEREQHQPDSMLAMYRHLIHLRTTCPALSVGDYRSLDVGRPGVFCFIRETELQRLVIVLNFSDAAADLELKGPVGEWIAGTHDVEGDGLPPRDNRVRLRAYEGKMYEMIQKG